MFIRIRSPSSAPPVRRRVGSTASTAMRICAKAAEEAVEDLVGDAALAGTAGTGDADDGRGARRLHLPFLAQPRERAVVEDALLDRRDRGGNSDRVFAADSRRHRAVAPCGHGALDEIANHRIEAELHAVVGVVDALDTVIHELAGFLGRDRAAAAPEYANVARAEFAQAIDHVAEELVMAALVGADGDTVRVLLHRRAHDVLHAAVVAEMDDLGALRLDQAPHDVDCRVMPVEQRRRGDEAQGGFSDLAWRTTQIARNRAHGFRSSGAKTAACLARKAKLLFKSNAFAVAKILMTIKIMHIRPELKCPCHGIPQPRDRKSRRHSLSAQAQPHAQGGRALLQPQGLQRHVAEGRRRPAGPDGRGTLLLRPQQAGAGLPVLRAGGRHRPRGHAARHRRRGQRAGDGATLPALSHRVHGRDRRARWRS